jgi:hypothetical protein
MPTPQRWLSRQFGGITIKGQQVAERTAMRAPCSVFKYSSNNVKVVLVFGVSHERRELASIL